MHLIKKGGIAAAAIWFVLQPHVFVRLYEFSFLAARRAGVDSEAKYEFFEVRGKRLRAAFFEHSGARRCVLLCLGTGASIPTSLGYVELLKRAGFSVFVFEYRGFGASEGRVTLRGMCLDAEAAYDHLCAAHAYNSADIVIMGGSVGGAVAGHLAVHRPCAAVVLRSTWSSLREQGREWFPGMRLYPRLMVPDVMDTSAALQKTAGTPVLIVHGEQDHVIGQEHARRLDAAVDGATLVLLPGCAHKLDRGESANMFLAALQEFFRDV